MRRAPRKDERVLKPLRPSAAIAALYRQKLDALIADMQRSYVYRLRAAFRRNPPRTGMAIDAALPQSEVENIIRGMLDRAKTQLGRNKWATDYVVLPDGTQVSLEQDEGRDQKIWSRFRVKYAGESDWKTFTRASVRTLMEDILTVVSPTQTLEQTLAQLGEQWQRNLDEAAPKLASYFAKAVDQRTKTELQRILRDGGISVRFQPTPAMKDIMQSTVVDSVGLIKSIGSEYHTQVQGLVMRSVQEGRDLAGLSRDLRERYGITKRRANLIALNQNNAASAAMLRARQTEAGIDEAIWVHSHAGKVPRPTHLANDGERYDPKVGWFDPDPKVRKHIWPSQLINCRCFSRPVVKGFS